MVHMGYGDMSDIPNSEINVLMVVCNVSLVLFIECKMTVQT